MVVAVDLRRGLQTAGAAPVAAVGIGRVEAVVGEGAGGVQRGQRRHLQLGHVLQAGDVTQLLVIGVHHQPHEDVQRQQEEPEDQHQLVVHEVQVLERTDNN